MPFTAPVAVNAPAKTSKPRRRRWIQRGDLESFALALLVLVVSVWYRVHLSVPQR